MSGQRDARRDLLRLVALTVITRLPAILFFHPIDDESIYAVVGNAIVAGGRPYLDAIERKPPLLFWTYAAIVRITGEYNWVALHVVSTLWVLATLAGLYVLARRLFDHDAGVVAALMYTVFQPWGFWKNLAFNGEVLMNLPIVWGWAIALGPPLTRRRFELTASGALLGAACLLKQPAAIAAVPLGLLVFHRRYRDAQGYSAADATLQAGLFTAGFSAPIAAAALVLARQGVLQEGIYWTITNHAATLVFWNRGVENTLAFGAACLPVLVAAALSLRDSRRWSLRAAERWALLAWLTASAVGAAAGGRFYPHYYIQLLPPLAVLAAPELARLWFQQRGTSLVWSRRGTQAWIALSACVFLAVNSAGLWLRRGEAPEVTYVREHSQPGDRIFVWGQSTNFYLEARRTPASRYIATFPLTGYIFGPRIEIDTNDRIVPGAWDNLEHDLDAHRPAFIVDTEAGPAARYPLERFLPMARRVASQYELVSHSASTRIYRRLPPVPADEE